MHLRKTPVTIVLSNRPCGSRRCGEGL